MCILNKRIGNGKNTKYTKSNPDLNLKSDFAAIWNCNIGSATFTEFVKYKIFYRASYKKQNIF